MSVSPHVLVNSMPKTPMIHIVYLGPLMKKTKPHGPHRSGLIGVHRNNYNVVTCIVIELSRLAPYLWRISSWM
mgnify:CR=1 FL=1